MRKIKVAIVGSRGIPAKYGGFETFAEELAIRLTNDFEVCVVGDNSNNYEDETYLGIVTRKSRYDKSKEPIKFYHNSLSIAKGWGADVAIMCGVGGVFSIPFYSNASMKIVVNPDGLGWKRDKWVWWKKVALYLQFLFCARFSKYIVCDSYGIMNFFRDKFKRSKNVFVAEYGSKINPFDGEEDTAYFKNEIQSKLHVEPYRYYLVVSRLEPENNVDIIVQGYMDFKSQFPLIIVGNTNTAYSRQLIRYDSDKVRFIGGVYDSKKLSALRYYSKAYFHGHSVGGTNPSLLEAMGSKNLCITHDNVFNREVLDNNGFFFSSKDDVVQVLDYIEESTHDTVIDKIRSRNLKRANEYYNWESIKEKYTGMINKVKNES